MIARLEGMVSDLQPGLAVLDVAGVGFAVFIPTSVELKIGKVATLHTYLHVREGELSLYGFTDADEKHLFELLLGVSGVGPKAALSILSTLSSDVLRRAIINEQPEVIARAPGVGKKTGQAVVLHLKDKISHLDIGGSPVAQDDADVISALTALGFSIVEAQRALQQLPRDAGYSLDEKIRRSLALLAG